MGRTFTPKYKLEMRCPGIFCTPMGWTVKENGQPTRENLEAYMDKYIASLKEGGANEHLSKHYGLGAVTPTFAAISYNKPEGPVLVEWHLAGGAL